MSAGPTRDLSTRVKVLVVGESGVGKTSLVASLAGRPLKGDAPWTVGCSVEVVLHQYRAGTESERDFLVELWDVGGSRSHRAARKVFYPGACGLILVHDLSNRKSEEGLEAWAAEVQEGRLGGGGIGAMEAVVTKSPSSPQGRLYPSPEDAQLPTLVVGAKADLGGGSGAASRRLFSRLSSEAEEVALDARRPLSPGSTASLQLAKFLDRAVAEFCRRTPGMASLAQAADAPASNFFSTGPATRRHL